MRDIGCTKSWGAHTHYVTPCDLNFATSTKISDKAQDWHVWVFIIFENFFLSSRVLSRSIVLSVYEGNGNNSFPASIDFCRANKPESTRRKISLWSDWKIIARRSIKVPCHGSRDKCEWLGFNHFKAAPLSRLIWEKVPIVVRPCYERTAAWEKLPFDGRNYNFRNI